MFNLKTNNNCNMDMDMNDLTSAFNNTEIDLEGPNAQVSNLAQQLASTSLHEPGMSLEEAEAILYNDNLYTMIFSADTPEEMVCRIEQAHDVVLASIGGLPPSPSLEYGRPFPEAFFLKDREMTFMEAKDLVAHTDLLTLDFGEEPLTPEQIRLEKAQDVVLAHTDLLTLDFSEEPLTPEQIRSEKAQDVVLNHLNIAPASPLHIYGSDPVPSAWEHTVAESAASRPDFTEPFGAAPVQRTADVWAQYGHYIDYEGEGLAIADLPEHEDDLESLGFYISNELWRRYCAGDHTMMLFSPILHPHYPLWLEEHEVNDVLRDAYIAFMDRGENNGLATSEGLLYVYDAECWSDDVVVDPAIEASEGPLYVYDAELWSDDVVLDPAIEDGHEDGMDMDMS